MLGGLRRQENTASSGIQPGRQAGSAVCEFVGRGMEKLDIESCWFLNGWASVQAGEPTALLWTPEENQLIRMDGKGSGALFRLLSGVEKPNAS